MGTPIEETERRLILATLEHCEGDKKKAAELLGISLKTLYNRLNVYNAGAARRLYVLQHSIQSNWTGRALSSAMLGRSLFPPRPAASRRWHIRCTGVFIRGALARRRTTTVARAIPKSPTGIAGLDEITDGGLPSGSSHLVCGGAGCGKTLLALEFLVRGATHFGSPACSSPSRRPPTS